MFYTVVDIRFDDDDILMYDEYDYGTIISFIQFNYHEDTITPLLF